MAFWDSSEVKFLRQLVEELRKDNAAQAKVIGLLADPLVLARQAGAERAMASTEVAVAQAKLKPQPLESASPPRPQKLTRPGQFRRTAERPDPAQDLTPKPKLTDEEAESKHTVWGA